MNKFIAVSNPDSRGMDKASNAFGFMLRSALA